MTKLEFRMQLECKCILSSEKCILNSEIAFWAHTTCILRAECTSKMRSSVLGAFYPDTTSQNSDTTSQNAPPNPGC